MMGRIYLLIAYAISVPPSQAEYGRWTFLSRLGIAVSGGYIILCLVALAVINQVHMAVFPDESVPLAQLTISAVDLVYSIAVYPFVVLAAATMLVFIKSILCWLIEYRDYKTMDEAIQEIESP